MVFWRYRADGVEVVEQCHWLPGEMQPPNVDIVLRLESIPPTRRPLLKSYRLTMQGQGYGIIVKELKRAPGNINWVPIS